MHKTAVLEVPPEEEKKYHKIPAQEQSILTFKARPSFRYICLKKNRGASEPCSGEEGKPAMGVQLSQVRVESLR
jgi:hypothetical protein